MTVDDVKSYLHIDADLTADDAILTSLMTAAQSYLTSATGKAYTDSDLEKTYIMLYVKQVYEIDNSPVLTNAMHAILSQIKLATEFKTVEEVEAEKAAAEADKDKDTTDTSTDSSDTSTDTTDTPAGSDVTSSSSGTGATESGAKA